MRTPLAITSAALLLAITACDTSGADAEATDATPEPQPTVTVTAEPEPQPTVTVTAEPEEPAEPTEANTENASDDTEEEPAEEPDPSDTGATEIGETVDIAGWGEGLDFEHAGTMTMNDIEVGFTNPECYDAPVNSHYLALNLTVEADADAYEEIVASQFSFYLIDDTGTLYRDEVQTMEAYACASTSGALDWVPPGTNHTGYIILDTDLTEGTIVYEGLGEDIHWTF